MAEALTLRDRADRSIFDRFREARPAGGGATPASTAAVIGVLVVLVAVAGWAASDEAFRPNLAAVGVLGAVLIFLAVVPPSRLQGSTAIVGAVAVVSGVLAATARLPLGPLNIGLSVVITVLSALPFAMWSRGRGPSLPFFPTISLVFGLLFGPGVLLTQEFVAGNTKIPVSLATGALLASLVALSIMQVTYYALVSFRPDAGRAVVLVGWRDKTWMTIATVGLFVYAVLPSVLPASLQQVVRFGGELPTLAFAELAVRWRLGRLSSAGKWFLLLAIPARVLLGLATSANFQAYVVFLIVGIATLSVRRRLPIFLVLGAVVGLAILQPVKSAYRTDVLRNGRPGTSALAQLRGYTDVASGVASNTEAAGDIRNGFASRFGYTGTLALVMSETPKDVSFWKGDTYTPLFFKAIPRAVFPGKPQEVTGQAFGHRYGLLNADDLTTSYNMPQLVELYANFGWFGIVIGSALFGVLYLVVQSLLTRRLEPLVGTSGLAYALSSLLVLDGAFSLYLSGVIYATVLVGSLHLIPRLLALRTGDRAPDTITFRPSLGGTGFELLAP